MKEFMEEYGGVIVTCMLGIMLLGLLYSLLASGGQLHRLAELFFLLSKLKTLDFTDFCPIFWYNDCKDFDKNKSFFLQFSYRF